jgi:hypothetical protein
MPLEGWIQNYTVARLLYDWQTLIAGLLAIAAAWRTIRATTKSANREVKASQEQTAVAKQQIETTVRLEQDRVASEARAFRTLLEAAMTRVLAEAARARNTHWRFFSEEEEHFSDADVLTVRQCITKGAFAELRAACVRQGGPLTGEFLDLEREIDNFTLQYPSSPLTQLGARAGLGEQLATIEKRATALRRKAAERI